MPALSSSSISAALEQRRIPVTAGQHGRGHGRQEHRTLKAAAVAAGLGLPHVGPGHLHSLR